VEREPTCQRHMADFGFPRHTGAIVILVAFQQTRDLVSFLSRPLLNQSRESGFLNRPGCRLAVEEEHVGLHALSVEDAGGQTQKGVHVTLVQEFAADSLTSPPRIEHCQAQLQRAKKDRMIGAGLIGRHTSGSSISSEQTATLWDGRRSLPKVWRED